MHALLELADADRGRAAIAKTQLAGGSLGKVDDPAAVEWPAIIDRDLDSLAGPLVGDGDLGTEGEGAMRRSHGVLVEDFS